MNIKGAASSTRRPRRNPGGLDGYWKERKNPRIKKWQGGGNKRTLTKRRRENRNQSNSEEKALLPFSSINPRCNWLVHLWYSFKTVSLRIRVTVVLLNFYYCSKTNLIAEQEEWAFCLAERETNGRRRWTVLFSPSASLFVSYFIKALKPLMAVPFLRTQSWLFHLILLCFSNFPRDCWLENYVPHIFPCSRRLGLMVHLPLTIFVGFSFPLAQQPSSF